jgi:bifunctional ADP-heptose synthase (sugar kinase/adenylyltransferase)
VLLVEPADTDADALAVLAALRQVDWVVSADPAGHADLLARIGPHLLLPARP